MRELTPCPGCQRHVRTAETRCPFCAQALALSHLPARVLPRSRLSRAATLAFGATLVSATALVGCGETEANKGDEGSAASGGSSFGGDTASAGSESGGAATGGANAAGSGGTDVVTPVVPPYGAPAVGGSNDLGGAGGIGDVETMGGAPAAGSGVGGGFIGIPK